MQASFLHSTCMGHDPDASMSQKSGTQ